MNRRKYFTLMASAALILPAVTLRVAGQEGATAVKVSPATMPHVGTIDERFQSYNIEMVEVTGGRFWKPYDQTGDATQSTTKEAPSDKSADEDQSRFQYRPPIDLTNFRLRKLASALALHTCALAAHGPIPLTFKTPTIQRRPPRRKDSTAFSRVRNGRA